MPICEADSWRLQYFTDVGCPPHVNIPTEDSDAWTWNPRYRWIYNKLAIALSQGLEAGPHGTTPPRFPVFSKPIINLKGMGVGSRVLESAQDYAAHYAPGHFWMTLLRGRHVSSDTAVVEGKPRWWRHVTAQPAGGGTFDYWTIHAEPEPEIEARCGAWIAQNLGAYTGMLNLETIGEAIIEAHLRFSDQWPDLYGHGWVEAVVSLYEHGGWNFVEGDRRTTYSVVLFGPKGPRYRHPPRSEVEAIRRLPGIFSVQITFDEDRDLESHAMPPGGFRLAIVNCDSLDVGFAARERLRRSFPLLTPAASASLPSSA
jgi:hypothetical protein